MASKGQLLAAKLPVRLLKIESEDAAIGDDGYVSKISQENAARE
jgi:hypothetical protein